jgi:hypothetical protein
MPDPRPIPRRTANYKQLPAHLHASFEALKKQEAKIKKLLATDEGQKAFLENPVAALEEAGVKLDGALRKVLAQGRDRLGPPSFAAAALLANGSTVHPRVRLRITT